MKGFMNVKHMKQMEVTFNFIIIMFIFTDRKESLVRTTKSYLCLVSGKSIAVYVEDPTATIRELNITVKEGELVVIKCDVTGVPFPAVTWYRVIHGNEVVLPNVDLEVILYSYKYEISLMRKLFLILP